MLKKTVIGNWKMNPVTIKEAKSWFAKAVKLTPAIKQATVVICPPSIYLPILKDSSKKIILGGQNIFWGDTGAFTGEISGEMLYGNGARYVILGHSERRALGENNELINKKVKSALASGLVPILCVGELERREGHTYFDEVKMELGACLKGISKDSIAKVIIAYEPVWAISSTKDRRDATPDDIREMIMFIRKTVSDIYSPELAHKTRVVYGGSVNTRDANDFINNTGADGFLVGKASLDPEKFFEIVKICEASSK